MSSHAKTQANRLNSLKHGIFARECLITAGDAAESVPDFEALDAALTAQAAPEGAIEQLLVEQLVAFAWRWRRVLRFENAAIAAEVQDATSAAEFEESVRDPSAFYGVSLNATPRDFAAELAAAEDLIAALDAPDPLAQATGLCGHAVAIAEYLGAPIGGLLDAEPPWRERSTFDSALVEQAIAAVCDRSNLSRSNFWALVRPSVEAARDRIVAGIERRNANLRSAQSLATIPSAAQLDKIHRYEAHLSRQFHRSLCKLQHLQAARGALPSPLEGEGPGMRGESEPSPQPVLEAPLPSQGRGRERGHEGPGTRVESESFASPASAAPLPSQGRGRERGHESPRMRGQSLPSPPEGEGLGMRGEAQGGPAGPAAAAQGVRPVPALNRSARRASLRQHQRELRHPSLTPSTSDT